MYMKVNKGQNTYNVEAYDRSDRLKMKGRSLDPKGQVWHGSFEFYHPNVIDLSSCSSSSLRTSFSVR